MNKNCVISFAIVGVLFVIAFASLYNESFAQTLEKNATISTKWTDFMADSSELRHSSGGFATVDVVYESDKTIVMKSSYIDALWKAADYVKSDGYKIDDVINYETGSLVGNSINLNFMVIMSKE